MRTTGICCLIALFAVVAARSVLAQEDPSFEIGLKPFGSYQMGDIDDVNLSNGSLGVDIPLISYPQRGGKLTLDFALHYFNGSSYQVLACYSEPFGAQCVYEPFGSFSGFEVIDKQALTYGPALSISGGYQPCTSVAGTATSLCNFQVSNTDGASHPYAPTSAASTSFRSIDASGILVSNASFIDPEGIVHTDVQYGGMLTDTRRDSNGNEITYSSAVGWTDTMGRTIPVIPAATSSGLSNCPQPPITPLPPTSAVVWSPPGPNGGTYAITFCYATVPYRQPWAGSAPELQSVALPDGTTWTFAYTSSPKSFIPIADLSEITFPIGGTLSYTWTTTAVCGDGTNQSANEAVLTRMMNPNDGVTPASQWTYAFTSAGTTVTDPMNNASVHTFGFGEPGTQNGCESYENQVRYYEGSSTSDTLLETVNRSYHYTALPWGGSLEPANVVPITEDTIWPGGQQSRITHSYDPGLTVCAPFYTAPSGNADCNNTVTLTALYGKELMRQDYDYGNNAPGNLLRTTTTTYLAFQNASYLNANLLDLPSAVQVSGSGSGSFTTYFYDQNNGSPQGILGNLTSTGRWLNTTNTYLFTSNVYNSYGMVTTITDPKGNPTNYGYSPISCPGNSGYAGSGPTSVTNALRQTTYYCYDLNSGLRTSMTDPNNLATSYAYDDMLRATQINYPDGGQTDFSYFAQLDGWVVNIRERMDTLGHWRTSDVWVDGLGRKGRAAVYNAETTPWDEIGDTCYNGLGLVSFKAYPYQDQGWTSLRSCAAAGDSFSYDALGRRTKVTQADGSVISIAYAGNSTTVADEQGRTRESFADALGRLSEVIEDPGTSPHLNYVTTYTYDALNNLTGVMQASSRRRTFIYDSLSRLMSSTNPESNWSFASQSYVATTYSYDADGNLVTKTEPAQNQQGTSQVTLTYCYDALNRMTAKAYIAQPCTNGWLPSPVAIYVYDGAAPPSGCSVGIFSYGLAIGKRTAMCDAAGSEAWSYNIVSGIGWQTTDQRTTNAVTKSTVYQDDFLGLPVSLQYPSGRTIIYSYNLGARPFSALDTTTSVYYANAAHYWAGGARCWTVFGAAITSAATYNARLQPQEMQSAGNVVPYPGSCAGLGQTGNLLDLSYSFNYGAGDNGNVMGITNNRDTTRSQKFTYDALNRLMTATSSPYATSPSHCWGERYQYDNQTTGGAWGNLTSIGVASAAYNGCTQESLSVTATAQNQISNGSTYGYDAAGNMTTNSGISYTYDAENHLTSTAGVTYIYDGEGKRVEKSSGKIYWYGRDGSVLDETDLTGSTVNSSFNEYLFFGGSRIARRDSSNNAYYYVADHLGTSRVIAEVPSGSMTAALCYDADFYPFGGERTYTTACSQNYKFTGKERDSESGLDNFGARYKSPSAGRFVGPDPAGLLAVSLKNPQTWNLYTYAMNNPLRYTDPTGKYTCADDNNKCQTDQDKAFEGARQRDLQSNDRSVVAAAQAYGDATKDNHVAVVFVSGDQGGTSLTYSTNGNTVTYQITVNIPGSHTDIALDEDVGHEGTHVGQDQALAASIKPNGNFNNGLNLTNYDAENSAYHVNAAIIQASGQPRSLDPAGNYVIHPGDSPAQVNETINRFLEDKSANPYGGVTQQNPGPPSIIQQR